MHGDHCRPRLVAETESELAVHTAAAAAPAASPLVIVLVGAPGSGKSTFCEQLMFAASLPWCRVNQVSVKIS